MVSVLHCSWLGASVSTVKEIRSKNISVLPGSRHRGTPGRQRERRRRHRLLHAVLQQRTLQPADTSPARDAVLCRYVATYHIKWLDLDCVCCLPVCSEPELIIALVSAFCTESLK